MGSFLHLSYASTRGSSADWQELGAVTPTATQQFYPNLSLPVPSAQFYRAWQTNVTSVQPVLQMGLATEITLTRAMGSNVRIDYINQFGPTDAWVTLDTVTLTNTSQIYFDTSNIGQPARLWRIVPLP